MSRGMMVMVLSIFIINQGAEKHFVCLWHGNLSYSEVIDMSDDDKSSLIIALTDMALNTEPQNYQGGIQKVREISLYLGWILSTVKVFTVVSWTTVSPDNRGSGNTWWDGAELHT